MSRIFEKFIELISTLEENEVEYILIGGLAINLHGFSRNTQDIDVFIKPNAKNINLLKKSLFKVLALF